MNEKPGDLIVNVHTDTPEEVDDNIVETSDESLKDASKTKQSETVDNQVDSSHHYNEPLISPEAVLRFKEDLRTDGISEEFIEELAKVRIENDEKNAGINTDVGAEIKNLEQVLEASPNIVAVDSNELHITDAESGEAVMTATDTEPAQNSLDRHDADLAAQAKLEKEAQGFDSTNNVVPFPNDAVFRTREEVARNQESLEDKLEMIKSRKPQTPDDVLTNHSDKQALLEEYDEYRNRIPEEDNFLETELSIAKGADDGNSAEDDIPPPEPLSQDSKHVELDVEPFPQNEGPNKIIVEESEDVVLETPKQEGVSKKLAPETAEKEEINTDGIEVEEVSEEIVMEGDTSSSSEDIGRETSEETVEKLDSFKNTEIFSEFGISSEDLTQIKGFKELSHGQRILVANGLKHLIKEEVPAKAKDTADRKLKESGFMGRMLRNIGKGGLLEKYKNEELKNLKAGGIEMHKDVLEEFVRDAQNGLGTEELEDGSVRFEFVPQYENLTPSQMETISKFNDFANAFANMPKSWVENGDDMQKESYAHAKLRYEEMTQQVIALELDRSGNNEDAALDFTNNIEGRVRMAQYMNGHPEIEKELNSIENNKVGRMAAGFLKTGAEYGGYFAFGFAARTAAVSALSLAGAPLLAVGGGVALTAGAIGGYRARKRAVESISDEDSKTVRGIESESATEKKLSDAEAFARNLERDAQQLEDAETDEQRARLAEKLITRYEVTMEKINDKAFVMGEGAKKIRNMSNMGYAISHAEAVLKLHQDAEAKSKVTEKYNQLITYANERAEEARGKKLKKSFWTGATISAAIAGAGFAARGIMEAYNTPETEVETSVASEDPQPEAVNQKSPWLNSEKLGPAISKEELLGDQTASGDPLPNFEHTIETGGSVWGGLEKMSEQYTAKMNPAQKLYFLDRLEDTLEGLSEDEVKDKLNIASGNIDQVAAGEKVNFEYILNNHDLMGNAWKEAMDLTDSTQESITQNAAEQTAQVDGVAQAPEAVAENVPIETEAQVADSIATETIPAEHVAESVAAEETLEKNGIVIEPEDEVMSQEQFEGMDPTEHKNTWVTRERINLMNTEEKNLNEAIQQAEKTYINYIEKHGEPPKLDVLETRHRTISAERLRLMKEQELSLNEATKIATERYENGTLKPNGYLYDSEYAKGVSNNQEQLINEKTKEYLNNHSHLRPSEALKLAQEDVLSGSKNFAPAGVESQSNIPPQVDTPNYTGEQTPESLTDENVAGTEKPKIKVVNYENLEDLDATPATSEQLGDSNYLLNHKLSSADYEQLSKIYRSEYREIEKDLKDIFDAENYEKQSLRDLKSAESSRHNELLKDLRKDIQEIRSDNRGKSGLGKVGGEIKEQWAENRYDNARDLSRDSLKEKYDHGFKFEWEESKQAINKMRVEDISDDSFTKRFQKGVNLIEGRNRRQFADYVEKLVKEVPNLPDENIQDYLYRVAGVRGSLSK